MRNIFDSEGEVVMWIAKQRAERPWLTETGLVAAAFALGASDTESAAYNRGYADGLKEGSIRAPDDDYDAGYDAGREDGYEEARRDHAGKQNG